MKRYHGLRIYLNVVLQPAHPFFRYFMDDFDMENAASRIEDDQSYIATLGRSTKNTAAVHSVAACCSNRVRRTATGVFLSVQNERLAFFLQARTLSPP